MRLALALFAALIGSALWIALLFARLRHDRQRLAESEARLHRALLDNNAAAILLAGPDRMIRRANQRAIDTFSADGRPLEGRSMRVIHRDDEAYAAFAPHYVPLRGGGEVQAEYLLCNARGEPRWFSMHGALLDPDRPDGDVIWTLIDVTERRRQERRMERLATTDALTGLANRRAFMARLDAELAQIARGGAGGMLMMLDLDHFKRINDGHGHAAGDAVLVHLAQLLREQLRRGDVAARLGGEEFAVLVPQTAPHDAVALAERLRVALEHSQIDIGSGFIQVTASLGLSPLEGDAVGVLARADVALYEAKRNGRNRVRMAGQEKMLAAI